MEYHDAAAYYAKAQESLGAEFADEVEVVIDEICAAPERWRCFEQDVRRSWLRRFPYAVLYTIERDFILILARMHTSREPGYWRTRLATSS